MKVFISWSGERSRAVAKALRDWLPNVIQAVQPWMSASDIDQGTRWTIELGSQLQESRIGVICLTPENLTKPSILFEAGALSKTVDQTYVCPYLIDLNPSDLTWPLSMFQATKADADGTRRLLHTINRTSANALPEPQLDAALDVWWPRLERRLCEPATASKSDAIQRTERALLEELINLGRSQALTFEETVTRSMHAALARNSLASLCGTHVPYPPPGNAKTCERVIGYKPYMLRPLFNPVPEYVLESHHFEWRGVTPPAGQGWHFSSLELDYLLAAGRIGFAGAEPFLRVYPGDPNY